MLGEVTPDLLTKNTPANHRNRGILLLVFEKESFVSADLGSSNSLCLKEPLPAELEIREDFNIKIYDCRKGNYTDNPCDYPRVAGYQPYNLNL